MELLVVGFGGPSPMSLEQYRDPSAVPVARSGWRSGGGYNVGESEWNGTGTVNSPLIRKNKECL